MILKLFEMAIFSNLVYLIFQKHFKTMPKFKIWLLLFERLSFQLKSTEKNLSQWTKVNQTRKIQMLAILLCLINAVRYTMLLMQSTTKSKTIFTLNWTILVTLGFIWGHSLVLVQISHNLYGPLTIFQRRIKITAKPVSVTN